MTEVEVRSPRAVMEEALRLYPAIARDDEEPFQPSTP